MNTNTKQIIQKIKESFLSFETMSADYQIFNNGVHSFLQKLLEIEAIKNYFVSYSSNQNIMITIEFPNGNIFEEQFTYDKELYNASTKQP